VLDVAALPVGARVLDIGCGKGALITRCMARGAASAVGVELSPRFAADARARTAAHAGVEILEMDGKDYAGPEAQVDLAACLGASWIFGGHAGTLAALARFVRPGGIVLVAEPFWVREPTDAYCASQEVERSTFGTHAENAAAGLDAGLVLLTTRVGPASAWDRYEGLQWNAAERWAADHPDDPDRDAVLSRMRAGRDAYLREGRDVLGDALYLFRRP
jgi:SAM-dependent methyltransferase